MRYSIKHIIISFIVITISVISVFGFFDWRKNRKVQEVRKSHRELDDEIKNAIRHAQNSDLVNVDSFLDFEYDDNWDEFGKKIKDNIDSGKILFREKQITYEGTKFYQSTPVRDNYNITKNGYEYFIPIEIEVGLSDYNYTLQQSGLDSYILVIKNVEFFENKLYSIDLIFADEYMRFEKIDPNLGNRINRELNYLHYEAIIEFYKLKYGSPNFTIIEWGKDLNDYIDNYNYIDNDFYIPFIKEWFERVYWIKDNTSVLIKEDWAHKKLINIIYTNHQVDRDKQHTKKNMMKLQSDDL